MTKIILTQMLLGIESLHIRGIVHSDLQPGNIIFPVKYLSHLSEIELAQSDPRVTTAMDNNGKAQFHQ